MVNYLTKNYITNQIKRKKNIKKIILLSITTAFILSTNAMSNSTLDGVYVTTATKTEKIIDGVSA